MSVTVRIPTQLRTLTGGTGSVAVEGSTVGEVLKALDAAHAGFADRIFDEAGGLRVSEHPLDTLRGLFDEGPHRKRVHQASRRPRPVLQKRPEPRSDDRFRFAKAIRLL